MSEMDVIVHLIGEYETSLKNGAQWQEDILELVKNQNDKRFAQNIMDRLVNATDNFRRSIHVRNTAEELRTEMSYWYLPFTHVLITRSQFINNLFLAIESGKSVVDGE